jgi:hypothetical protein
MDALAPGDLLRLSIELGLVTAERGGAILVDGERITTTRDPLPPSEKIDPPHRLGSKGPRLILRLTLAPFFRRLPGRGRWPTTMFFFLGDETRLTMPTWQ